MMVGVHWTRGYTRSELDAAQERFQFRFPPDLLDLFLDRRPVEGWDWRLDHDEIADAFAWPLEGILFDVEHNDLWWPEWGDKPRSAGARCEVVTAVVQSAPRLIPIVGHRYIPEHPHQVGNPIFSVMQSDVIYYGADLAEYFSNEFGETYSVSPCRDIPFWSELVIRAA